MKQVKEFIVKVVFPEDKEPFSDNAFADILLDAFIYFEPYPDFDVISSQVREATADEVLSLWDDEDGDEEEEDDD